MKKLYDILMPRFITEYVVLIDTGFHYEPLCGINDLEEHEFNRDMVFQQWRSFNLFGMALFPTAVGAQWQVSSFSELTVLPGYKP